MSSRIGKNFKLGILGGGQLGRMFIQESINYDVHVHIMDSNDEAPAASCANSFTLGDINSYEDVIEFGRNMDLLTVEIENVNVKALYELERQGVTVYPQPRVLEIIKDKGLQKQFYAENNIPTSSFQLLDANADVDNLQEHLPFVQKLRTGGYDGRGVIIMKSEKGLEERFLEPSIIEDLVDYEKEISVIVSRNEKGDTAVFPTVECEFNDVNLVEFLFSPAEVSTEVEKEANKLAVRVINTLEMVGVLAVELFITKDGQLLVNEVAPRPHNSGHHTIECNDTSQFEQHLRSIMGWELGSTKMTHFGAMINLLGAENHQGPAHYLGLEDVLSNSGTQVHLYGKSETKPHRKMGHVTVFGDSLNEVREKAAKIKSQIKVISAVGNNES